MAITTMKENDQAQAFESVEDIWENCKLELKNRIPAPFYQSFIQPLTADNAGKSRQTDLRLFAPDEQLVKHIESRYFPIIQETLREGAFQGQVSLLSRNAETTALATDLIQVAPEVKPKTQKKEENLSFIVHPTNSTQVESLRTLHFPSAIGVIQGESGSGKTILARELVESARKRGVEARYHTLESFLTDFSMACREKETIRWRNELRSNSLLVIDDFQFMKKTALKSQEELRNIIDDFQESGRKIIICMDSDMSSLKLQADLKSRFFLSYRVQLMPASGDGRRQILTSELRKAEQELSSACIHYVSERINGDARRLQSAALRLKYYLGSDNLDPDPHTLDHILKDLYSQDRALNPGQILKQVADFLKLAPHTVTGPARDKKYTLARHMTAYLCHQLLDMTLVEIAAVIGRKDHGTVIHALKKIKDMMQKDLFFERQIQGLTEELKKL